MLAYVAFIRAYLPLVVYWLLAVCWLVCAQIPGSWFISNTTNLVFWLFLFRDASRRIKCLLTATILCFYGLCILALVPIRIIADILPTINAIIIFLTILIVLIRSYQLFGFNPNQNVDLRNRCIIIFLSGLMLITFFFTMAPFLSVLRPEIYDFSLYAIGMKLGPASAVMGQAFHHYPWINAVCLVNYALLPALLLCVYYLQSLRPDLDLNVMRLMVAIACGVFIYLIVPAVGPKVAFGARWPYHMPVDAAALSARHSILPLISRNSPRNCMPSLHAAWGLALAFSGWELGIGWGILFSFISLSIIAATLGLGEHYVVDLIVAFPFTVALWTICHRRIPPVVKWVGSGLCTVIVAAWLLAITTSWIQRQPPLIIWIMTAASLIYPFWLLCTARKRAGTAIAVLAD